MPSFVPLLFYDHPSSTSRADHHHSDHNFSDGASSVSAIIQTPLPQATPRLAPETSVTAGTGKSLSSRQSSQTTDRQKLKKVSKKKSQRVNQCIDTWSSTGLKSDHELKDATSIVKDETMRENEVTVKAKHFVHAVRAVKKAVYIVQMALFEGVGSESQLQAASALLTEGEYGNVIIERSISQLCGFPLCKQPLQLNSTNRGHYRISLREHKVYDTQEQKLFCSSYCLIASKTFATMLQAAREGTVEQEKLEEIVAAVHGLTLVSNTLKEDDANLKVHESSHSSFEDFENVGPSDAIEGYVPQQFPGRGRFSSFKEQDDPLSALDIDKPSIMKLKSALSGTRKKHGIHVSWADDFDMVPASEGSQLGEPKDPVVLTSHMLETATIELTECLVDAGTSNISCELDISNIASKVVEPVVDLSTISKDRLASAEALAFALTEAAAATETGELEPSEAGNFCIKRPS
ncbi:hypothetical protein O6H91_10G000800 [Diphasiastrum complanatum]|uniref:Uncharacterized protein n=1 Tax=Diphasiastrum complanatum TaxID=34168 RepID=A0ACC2CDF0_DIPCM|nr:hypothetical protein O6H91_10G000800 [Diphasiastrum complanatum]